MTTEAPEHLYGLSPVSDLDANTKALQRLATAVEQLTLTLLDKGIPPQLAATTAPTFRENIQAVAGPIAGLAPLPAISVNPVGAGTCPVHRVPWKMVPAGISKKNNRPYNAFLACPERGCDQRPPQ